MSFAFPPPRRAKTDRELATKHVVLVEDDEAYRYSVEKDLVRRGFVVHAFESGLDALDYVDGGGEIDALVTDLALPAGTPNGLSLANMMRRRRPGLPVAMMTGYPDLGSKIEGRLGAVLPKSESVTPILQALGF